MLSFARVHAPALVVIDRGNLHRLKLWDKAAAQVDRVLVLPLLLLEHLHVLHLGGVLVRVEAVRVRLLAPLVHGGGVVGGQSTGLVLILFNLTWIYTASSPLIILGVL